MDHAISYQHCHDARREAAELAADAHEAAVDAIYLRLKRDDAVQAEVFAHVMDSGVPATNPAHEWLIERIFGLGHALMFATDSDSVRRRMLALDALVSTALDAELVRRAEAEVRA